MDKILLTSNSFTNQNNRRNVNGLISQPYKDSQKLLTQSQSEFESKFDVHSDTMSQTMYVYKMTKDQYNRNVKRYRDYSDAKHIISDCASYNKGRGILPDITKSQDDLRSQVSSHNGLFTDKIGKYKSFKDNDLLMQSQEIELGEGSVDTPRVVKTSKSID